MFVEGSSSRNYRKSSSMEFSGRPSAFNRLVCESGKLFIAESEKSIEANHCVRLIYWISQGGKSSKYVELSGFGAARKPRFPYISTSLINKTFSRTIAQIFGEEKRSVDNKSKTFPLFIEDSPRNIFCRRSNCFQEKYRFSQEIGLRISTAINNSKVLNIKHKSHSFEIRICLSIFLLSRLGTIDKSHQTR